VQVADTMLTCVTVSVRPLAPPCADMPLDPLVDPAPLALEPVEPVAPLLDPAPPALDPVEPVAPEPVVPVAVEPAEPDVEPDDELLIAEPAPPKRPVTVT
jgi:hypothetical protein